MWAINRKWMWVVLCVCCLTLHSYVAFAAVSPEEIKEIKRESSVALKGEVVKDRLIKDQSKGDLYKQDRVMTLSVQEITKGESKLSDPSTVDVFYRYIPTWQRNQYAGGKAMDIAVGDVIKIWLDPAAGKWESSSGGDTVEHIIYKENRSEPLKEPLSHRVQEKMSIDFFTENQAFFVIALLSIILVIVGFFGVQNKRS
ncbi:MULTISPECIES: hypothetical protein [Pontibacillus]|uniref:Uncharacterized protein n=1 Tax=Pontibacillus chungwhensis TaxID=265426 RepID=A0ABY8V585_9BACI|nr:MULTISPECIES: hypothetical protein [Pontibacillus]MCD5322459.1 hypothetical protein [Pontibacillus sp. HN14]WIF99745.1 hypothetical protein QNI29_08840 [Pontibacillus chungwhensis]